VLDDFANEQDDAVLNNVSLVHKQETELLATDHVRRMRQARRCRQELHRLRPFGCPEEVAAELVIHTLVHHGERNLFNLTVRELVPVRVLLPQHVPHNQQNVLKAGVEPIRALDAALTQLLEILVLEIDVHALEGFLEDAELLTDALPDDGCLGDGTRDAGGARHVLAPVVHPPDHLCTLG